MTSSSPTTWRSTSRAEGEVLVRVQHCGVCHSDLHFVDGSLPCAYPSILGHEAGGIVEAVGFGVTDVVDPASGDAAVAAMEITNGLGVDYAFDAVGSSTLVETCINAIRPGGTAVMVGVPKIDQFLNVHALMFAMGEKRRAGKLDLEGMVTSRRSLAEIGEAFDDMKAGKGLRTVLTM